MDETLDLKFLFDVFKKYWLLISAAAIVCGAGTFAFTYFLVAPKYQSEAMLYVENSQNQLDKVNSSDLSAAQQLVSTCQILFKSNSMMDSLISELDLPYTKSQLSDMLSAQSVNSTEVMKLDVVSKDPQEAATIVNVWVELSRAEFGRVIKTGSIELISNGEVNTKPVSPNKLLNTAAGFLAGLILVYIVFFLKEMFDVAVKHDDDLAKIYDIPVFAEISDFDLKEKNKKYGYGYGYGYGHAPKRENDAETKTFGFSDARHFLDENTPFAIAEAYKAARTNILFAVAPSERKIIAVTSANPSEGKSTTCTNIAIAFANANNKVLLIDCDLRKPTMKTSFGIKNNNGLSTILGGFCKTSEAINSGIYENLDIITAGAIPPNPSELLGSESMKTLLAMASEQYDYVFLDTPPVSVVTDAQLMNDVIAGLILVVKENSTTHPDVVNALEKTNLANGKALGFVKTFSSTGKGRRYGKYKYSYDYKYGYGTEEKQRLTADKNV